MLPDTITTAEFGVLELDRQSQAYIGKANWCGSQARLILSCSDAAELKRVLETSVSLFQQSSQWNSRIRELAAHELLAVKNGNWLEDDEAELSREEFLSRMLLKDIQVDESGVFVFSHDDDDMFWGHRIIVVGDFQTGLRLAEIAG